MAGHEIGEFGVDVSGQIPTQDIKVDAAALHHRSRILVFQERQQQVLQGREFLSPLVCKCQCLMQRFL